MTMTPNMCGTQAFLSRPLAGKHIAFDGRLLHGAPADANAWHADKGASQLREIAGGIGESVGDRR
eukprot:3935761-Rhodomonas_salina.1